jgi:hypothetical protein
MGSGITWQCNFFYTNDKCSSEILNIRLEAVVATKCDKNPHG